MKQKIKLKLFGCCFFLLIPLLNLVSQSPASDQNWGSEVMIDDFTNPINYNIWAGNQDFDPADFNWDVHPDYAQVDVATGHLVLTAEKQTTGPYDVLLGELYTIEFYSYGYYEASIRVPDAVGRYMPAFWLMHSACSTEGWYNEIDGVELLNWENYMISSNYHIYDGPPVSECTPDGDPEKYREHFTIPQIITEFQTFGIEWTPNRFVFYLNNIPYRYYYKEDIPDHDMRLFISLRVGSGTDPYNPVENYINPDDLISDPAEIRVDYISRYELNMADCNSDATISNNNQLETFSWGVKRNITIGNGSSTISLQPSDNVTFRASNDIIINGEFSVPMGAEFNLVQTDCY